MNLITLENVSKQYSERQLLDQINLLVNDGDRIGLIGLNGSGKSTLLRLVAGLEAPDAGQMMVRGGTRIQYLPQEPPLDDSLTVLAQLFDSDSPRCACCAITSGASQQLHEQPDNRHWQEQLTA
ncbi:MAG: ABC-F family ATP-binding cassette domain-containing protein, partial [Anaerolineales bacterium]|nr:ABC-F family ATP-binding cassette domain-containing protein [Anaerolineales bacterium]